MLKCNKKFIGLRLKDSFERKIPANDGYDDGKTTFWFVFLLVLNLMHTEEIGIFCLAETFKSQEKDFSFLKDFFLELDLRFILVVKSFKH